MRKEYFLRRSIVLEDQDLATGIQNRVHKPGRRKIVKELATAGHNQLFEKQASTSIAY